jgi:hypothetical protein
MREEEQFINFAFSLVNKKNVPMKENFAVSASALFIVLWMPWIRTCCSWKTRLIHSCG